MEVVDALRRMLAILSRFCVLIIPLDILWHLRTVFQSESFRAIYCRRSRL